MTAPTLVLVGELDDWMLAAPCRDMIAGKCGFGISQQPGDRSMVELVVYPGIYHSFLAADLPSGFRVPGHWLEYNEAATQDAISRVRSFFERALAD